MRGVQFPLIAAGQNLPLMLTLYEDASLQIDKAQESFPTFIDSPECGIQAIISDEDIAIGANTVVEYGQAYRYKDMPEFKAWLVSLNLQRPF